MSKPFPGIILVSVISITAGLVWTIMIFRDSSTVRHENLVVKCVAAGGEMVVISEQEVCFKMGMLDLIVIRKLTPILNN